MRRRPCIAPVALFCLLALTPSASAEEAWVLWSTMIIPPREISRMLGSASDHDRPMVARLPLRGKFSTRNDCQHRLRELEDSDATKDAIAGGLAVAYECLPDTVDQRAPKGK